MTTSATAQTKGVTWLLEQSPSSVFTPEQLSDEQRIFICWINKLGHTAHVITSMSEFFEIVK